MALSQILIIVGLIKLVVAQVEIRSIIFFWLSVLLLDLNFKCVEFHISKYSFRKNGLNVFVSRRYYNNRIIVRRG